jgi:hypothetical protein
MRALFATFALTVVVLFSAHADAALVCASGSHSCGPTRGCCPAGSECLPVSGCSVRPQDRLGVKCGKYQCRVGEVCIRQEGQLRCR